MQKPIIPKGMRDFNPTELARRNYIFETIKFVYRTYGFQQIETPSMEQLSTLMGKYGDEGDKLLFKVLNSGDFLKDVDREKIEKGQIESAQICEKGLRYDLTVPFARYVVMHKNKLTFPFKRFQIQPVWRADRPQKGRYREFYQCDADIIGSESLLNEVELIQIINDVFERLEIPTQIHLNNRKVLVGIAQVIGQENRLVDITVAIDKLDKIGLEKVKEELLSKGFNQQDIKTLEPILLLEGENAVILEKLSHILQDSEDGIKGIEELSYILKRLEALPLTSKVKLDFSLARGLSYYTGAILEVKALNTKIGSISGGGRYDDLTGVFGLNDMSGVGISFGADRIYDVMLEENLFPNYLEEVGSKVLIVNFGVESEDYILTLISDLRKNGISSEYYPDSVKLKKQLSYANSNNISYVILIGEDELNSNTLTIKNMKLGTQDSIKREELIKYLAG